MRASMIAGLVVAIVAGLAPALAQAPGGPVRLASIEEARTILATRDAYVAAMSDADVSIRLADPHSVDRAVLLQKMGASARPFTATEQARLAAMIARTKAQVAAVSPWLPREVVLIKSSRELDGGWPHTRANAIVLGAALPPTESALDALFFHELWHVMSRAHPQRLDAIYGVLGFVPCTEFVGWEGFTAPRLTNPDAVVERHVLPLPGARGGYALPVLRTLFPRYRADVVDFGDYIAPIFVRVERNAGGRCEIEAGPQGPTPLPRDAVTPALAALATRDTNYVWHPEEMTADLFSLLMTDPARAKDPHQLARLAFLLGYQAR